MPSLLISDTYYESKHFSQYFLACILEEIDKSQYVDFDTRVAWACITELFYFSCRMNG